MKKFLPTILSFLSVMMLFSLFFWNTIVPYIEQINQGKSLGLVGIVSWIGQYFKYADSWNIQFAAIFLSSGIILLALIQKSLDHIVMVIKLRRPTWKIMHSPYMIAAQMIFGITMVGMVYMIGANLYIGIKSQNHIVQKTEEIEAKMPVLLLGTSKMLSNGVGENIYYRERITATIELYKKNKVQYVLISGDGGGLKANSSYDETRDMRLDLINKGIPEHMILIDTAGYRTIDSMFRIRQHYGINHLIIVSQEFHIKRALILSRFFGIDAIGYRAKGSQTLAMFKREVLISKPALLVDLFLLNTMPKVIDNTAYRKELTLDSDFEILGVAGTIILLILASYIGFRVLENRTQGLQRYIAVAVMVLVGTVMTIGSVYSNTNTRLVDVMVEKMVKTTGIGEELVELKKARTDAKKRFEQKVINVQKMVEQKTSPGRINSVAEIDNQKLKSTIEQEQKSIEMEKTIAKPFKLLPKMAEQESSVYEDAKLKEKENAEKPKKSAWSTVSFNKNKQQDMFSDAKNGHQIKVKIHTTQPLLHNGTIQLRLGQDLILNNRTLKQNKIFEATVYLIGGRGQLRVQRIGPVDVESEIYSPTLIKGIQLSDLRRDKKGNYTVADGMEMILKMNMK